MERGAVWVLILITATLCVVRAQQAVPCYPALFFFGDSLEDTGNGPFIHNDLATMLPYGVTYPGWADLRFTDGRVIVDFLATYLRLPKLNPSLNSELDFSQGVNYAVPGATALSVMEYSLEVQIGWHLALRAEVSASGDTPGRPRLAAFDEALYAIQLGGNDYFRLLWEYYSPEYLNVTLVPRVVREIRTGVERLYMSGARNFLIFGIVPQGCTSAALSTFPEMAVDNLGCVTDVNAISVNHRAQLLTEIQSLRTSYPDANFIFADYHNAYLYILEHMGSFGFTMAFDACCGAGNAAPYGYDRSNYPCANGTESLFVCRDPSVYLNWDGLHYTDKCNFQIFNHTIFTGIYLDPHDGLATCASKTIELDIPALSNYT